MVLSYEKFEDNGDLYVSSFLIDDTLNSVQPNPWKVTTDSIDRNVQTFVGMPLVLYEQFQGYFDHALKGDTLMELVRNQERFAIGRIEKVVKSGSKWKAITRITNEQAKQVIKNHEIPFYVSPTIVHDPAETNGIHQTWAGLQLAVVSEPGYGIRKAQITGLCEGDGSKCMMALASASKEDCGFCVKTVLLSLVGKQPDNSSLITSQTASAAQIHTVMSAIAPQIDTSKFVSVEEHNAIKTQYDALKVVVDEAKSSYQKEIDALKEDRRLEKISAEVRAKISDPAKADEKIKKFMETKTSPELVAEMLALIPAPQTQSNESKFSSAAVASASKGNDGRWIDSMRGLERSLIK